MSKNINVDVMLVEFNEDKNKVRINLIFPRGINIIQGTIEDIEYIADELKRIVNK